MTTIGLPNASAESTSSYRTSLCERYEMPVTASSLLYIIAQVDENAKRARLRVSIVKSDYVAS
jgi:hypothetical protein